MLSDLVFSVWRGGVKLQRLNAPYDAPHFLTGGAWHSCPCASICLNAPYGAPRFLSEAQESDRAPPRAVLMHRMALRAF